MIDRAEKAFLIVITAFFVVVAVSTLQWRMVHDSPIMMYIAFMMDKFGYVPYRDIFDMNMLGTDFAYYVVGRFSRFTDIGFRIADLLCLSGILAMTWLWNRKLGWKVATTGAVLFGLLYLKSGRFNSMQREYLMILPVVTGLWIASFTKGSFAIRSALVGLMWGIATAMKPQVVIGFPLVVAYQLVESQVAGDREPSNGLGRSVVILLTALLGFAVPVVAIFAYLERSGALASFLDIAVNYWPLYNRITGTLTIATGSERVQYLLDQYRQLGGNYLWLAPAAVGAFVALFNSVFSKAQKRQVVLLLGLTLCYGTYPLIAGKFWFYHWLLFLFFLTQLGALCFAQQPSAAPSTQRLFPFVVMLIVVLVGVGAPGGFYDQLRGQELSPPKNGRVDQIAEYLRSNLRPGDEVQPLDWTGGAVHAMLLAQAKLATPFVYDFHFYHHISQPYTQNLRKRFMEDLQASKPRFIIQIQSDDKPWLSGPDTTREFPELQTLLEGDYKPSLQGEDFTVFEVNSATN